MRPSCSSDVGAVLEDLAGGRVERDGHVVARAVAGGLDPRDQHLERRLVRVEVRREAALVSHGRGEPAVVEGALQGVEDLHSDAEALREARRPHRHDHELLEVDLVVGVRAAVQHVHHRHRQHVRRLAPEVAPERRARLRRGGLGRSQRDAEDRVGAEPCPCWACRPARSWCGRARPGRRGRGRSRPAASSPFTFATAVVTPLPAQASPPSRSSTASNSPVDAPEGTAARPSRARLQDHVHLNGGVSARVEDLTPVDLLDAAHSASTCVSESFGRLAQGELRIDPGIERIAHGRREAIAGVVARLKAACRRA